MAAEDMAAHVTASPINDEGSTDELRRHLLGLVPDPHWQEVQTAAVALLLSLPAEVLLAVQIEVYLARGGDPTTVSTGTFGAPAPRDADGDERGVGNHLTA
jgi:hypothetical protein